jgi:hypothetical protein
MTPSDATQVLDQWRLLRTSDQRALFQDIELLLDAPQRDRWGTAMAAVALARSPWPVLFPQERLDLDALLVQALGTSAQSPQWLALRSQWLAQRGAAIADRDRVLAEHESKLFDAMHRKQPGLVLHLERQNIAARARLTSVIEAQREEMASAMTSLDTVNTFQRALQRHMHPDVWGRDDIDRLALAALNIEGLDANTTERVQAAWARHRSRRAAVQSHLVGQSAAAAERRNLRPQEHRVLSRMFGHGAALIGLSPNADAPLSKVQHLNSRLREARRIAKAELAQAIGPELVGEVQAIARKHIAQRQARLTAQPPGTASLILPTAVDESAARDATP